MTYETILSRYNEFKYPAILYKNRSEDKFRDLAQKDVDAFNKKMAEFEDYMRCRSPNLKICSMYNKTEIDLPDAKIGWDAPGQFAAIGALAEMFLIICSLGIWYFFRTTWEGFNAVVRGEEGYVVYIFEERRVIVWRMPVDLLVWSDIETLQKYFDFYLERLRHD